MRTEYGWDFASWVKTNTEKYARKILLKSVIKCSHFSKGFDPAISLGLGPHRRISGEIHVFSFFRI